ncbi:MAG: FAD-binding protein [Planctomycetes bacterium]|nr:FAD-binding protein [Planctomycetota bacterium]
MKETTMNIDGRTVPVIEVNTVIVGTGAAGLNCACRLFREMEETGVADPASRLAVVTRGVGLGTSNNSGSDKQTYYKMGTSGTEPDLAVDFARTLTAGGCTHADVALIEGANSLRGFYRLADLGVPFPHNANGGFIGYKTDHDPRQRGTSAGPWTSRFMVRKLLVELRRYGIAVYDRFHVLAVLTDGDGACGVLCLNLASGGLTVLRSRNVVAAGGGPGELYEISVYPKGQMGPYAQLFEAGAAAHNLTESQFGLASIDPRWNLSGTYQQVIPRYYSTDAEGNDEREFLNPWFPSMAALATDIFLKGYQWPFDHDKVADFGSSLIDILVQNEMINKGRRVFMDFRENPRATDGLEPFALEDLDAEALGYLERSGAMQATPIERLAHMNPPSIELYAQMGVDLWKAPLEIGVCSQHCNGGFAVDAWWESTVRHLFVVGELAGTHGVKRPGGSALNAGQVGSMRAAQRIAHLYHDDAIDDGAFARAAQAAVRRFGGLIAAAESPAAEALDAQAVVRDIQHRMSAHAGMVRSAAGVKAALAEARDQWKRIRTAGLKGSAIEALEARELALAQLGFLTAVDALLKRGSGSRGSHLVTDPSGELPHRDLGDEWRFIGENLALRDEILTVTYDAAADAFTTAAVAPRRAEATDDWFENTWAAYRDASVFATDGDGAPLPYAIYQTKKH